MYNLDVGENYYMPMTTYLNNKTALDSPGALSFRYVEIYLIVVGEGICEVVRSNIFLMLYFLCLI